MESITVEGSTNLTLAQDRSRGRMETVSLQAKRLQSVPVLAQTSITELVSLFGVKAWLTLFQGPVFISEAAARVSSMPFDLGGSRVIQICLH